MSPLHRDANGVRVVASWQSVVEEKIAAARERGDFDNLPGAGRPLKIEENPLAGDWELAFHVLETADMAPPWMEMSKEIREGRAALAAQLDRTSRYLQEQVRLMEASPESPKPEETARSRFHWWPFWRARSGLPAEKKQWDDRAVLLDALDAERRRARRAYLDRAAHLDEVIAAYNGWLPDNLRRLQKPRLSPARAAREFDAACPPVAS